MRAIVTNVICRASAVLLVAGALSSVPAAEPGRRLALIIGNSAYVRRPLRNPVNDARLIDQALKSVGFQTILKENATKQDMEEAAAELVSKIAPGDTVLFYYAGHAVQIQNENFVIPTDLDRVRNPIDAKYKMLSMAKLFEYLAGSPAAQRIVILDSCRTNPVENTGSTAAGLAMPLNAGKETYVIFSTSPNMVAEDNPDGRNSYFTEALAELIAKPGLTIDDMMTQVNRRVEKATEGRQTPWKQGSLTRRFYFVAQSEEAAVDDPTVAETQFREARRQAGRRNWDEALALVEQVSKARTEGRLLDSTKQLQRYISACRSAEAAFAKGDYPVAGASYAEAYKLDGDSYCGLQAATSYLMANKLEDAVRLLADLRYRGDSESFKRANAMLRELAGVSETARAEVKKPNPAPPRPVPVEVAWDDPAGASARAAELSQENTLRSLPALEEYAMLVKPAAPPAEAAPAAAPEAKADAPPPAGAEFESVLQVVSLGDNRDLVFQDLPAAEPKVNTSGVARPGAIQVKVSTAPYGATLSVEGDPEQTCASPCVLSLAPGRRVVRAAKKGYRDEARIVQVKAGQSDVNMELMMRAGKVRLEGAGAGLPIMVDGRLTNDKTPALLQLPEGKYQVRMIVKKNVTSTEEVEVKDGGLQRIEMH